MTVDEARAVGARPDGRFENHSDCAAEEGHCGRRSCCESRGTFLHAEHWKMGDMPSMPRVCNARILLACRFY